jgi:hypothetical protein
MGVSPKSAKPRTRKMKRVSIPNIVQITVLVWSAGILTAGWVGVLKNADTTFTAGIFTSILANFGVQSRRNQEEEEEKQDSNPSKPVSRQEPKAEPTSVIRSSKAQTP